jgi:hypothetical protein
MPRIPEAELNRLKREVSRWNHPRGHGGQCGSLKPGRDWACRL